MTTKLSGADTKRPTPPGGSWGGVGGLARRLISFPASSVTIATIALIVIIGALHPRFVSPGQLEDVLQSSVYTGVMAIGLAYLIAMRDIDLSPGTTFALSLIVAAILMRGGMNPWLAAVCALLTGAACGLFNALIVAFIKIPTIITTLATLSMYGGLATGLAGGEQVIGLPTDSSFFTILGGTVGGFPIAVIVMVVVSIPLGIALHHTPWGYRVLAMGSNPDAADFSGISQRRVRTQVLVVIGLLAGIAGCLALAFFNSGSPTIGTGSTTLDAIAAAVIGGTPLRGGSASVLGAMIGAVLLNVVNAGLPYFGIQANWTEFVTGIVIIVAVGFDSLVRYQQHRGAARAAAL